MRARGQRSLRLVESPEQGKTKSCRARSVTGVHICLRFKQPNVFLSFTFKKITHFLYRKRSNSIKNGHKVDWLQGI